MPSVKNIVIDYHDKNMKPIHQAMQVMNADKNSDDFIVDFIRIRLRGDGYGVYSIIEVIGNYTLEELAKIAEVGTIERVLLIPLYIKPDKVSI